MVKKFLEDNSKKNLLKKQLYQIIQKEGPISKMDLIEKCRLPQTTMSRLIANLEEIGAIRVSGLGKATGGRPPILYDIVEDASFSIGIEIARTHVEIVLLNSKFKIVDLVEFTLTTAHTPVKTINEIITQLKKLLSKSKLKQELLLGMGIGAVGPLDRERGLILKPESFLAPGWENVPIVSMLSKEFPIPIILNNGANTAALAEYQFQSLEGESILYCINGFGVRCGFIQNGRFATNNKGNSSSYGHMIIQPNGKACYCGRKGCLTAYTSFGGIFNQINKKRKLERLEKVETVEQLLTAIENKDFVAKEAVLESAFYYGMGIANMINILHPTVVVLHGLLIYRYEEYFQEVKRVASDYIYSNSTNVTIRKGYLGESATAVGASLLVFYKYFEVVQ